MAGGKPVTEGKGESKVCLQEAANFLNCVLSSNSLTDCEEAYNTFRSCASQKRILKISLTSDENPQSKEKK
jgi:F0F1-type ATP synthase delta subunit